jgi:hypothetical protein
VGHLWYNSGTNFAGSLNASTLRGTLLPGRSGLLNHLPLDSRLRLPSEAHFILAGAWPELSYLASWSVSRPDQLRERHAFNMNRKGSKSRSLIDTGGVTVSLPLYKPPPGLLSYYTRFFFTIANIANRATCIFL